MTQLTVSIEDVSMLDQIRQAISLLRGVTSVTLKQQNKSGMDRSIRGTVCPCDCSPCD